MAKKPTIFKYKATVTSNYPDYVGSWGIELEDEAEFAFYQNLASDLTAALYAKLGQEFSKYRLDEDVERLTKAMSDLDGALRGTILD
jgi:hypothetical protein